MYLRSPRYKAKFNLLIPNPANINAVMDAIKITDTCLFVISKNGNGIDADGDALFQLIYSFNLPTSLFVVQVGVCSCSPLSIGRMDLDLKI
jgi:hypothetical protein